MRANRHRLRWPLLLACAAAGCAPETPPSAPPAPPPEQDGYDAPMLSGRHFLVDELEVVPSSQALDQDGNGTPDGAINRALEPMRDAVNSAFRNSVHTDHICVAIELAGVDEPYGCADNAVTLKYYTCDDADQDPANNFCGAPDCGRMILNRDVVDLEASQAIYRTEPAPILACRLQARLNREVGIDLGDDDLRLNQAVLAAYVPETLAELIDFRIAGVAPMRSAQQVTIPICEYMPVLCVNPSTPAEISLAEYMRLIGEHPDVDVDGDGLERYDLDSQAHVLRCIDGDGTVIEDPNCLYDDRIVDAFSLCLGGHAVSAVLLLP